MPTRALRPVILAIIPLACFDPPELDEAPPPLADLGTIDTWAEIEEAGPPAEDDGPSSGEAPPTTEGNGDGPESGSEDEPLDPALAQLRITEILANPEGTDGGTDSPEFVEISNPGPLPVKLDGLRVNATSWPMVDAAELGLAGLELELDGILVIRRWTSDGDPALAAVELASGVVWTGFLHSGALRNTDGSVSLETATMSIDQVVYGPDTVPAPGSGLSLCRLGPAQWEACAPNPGPPGPASDGPDDPDEPTPIPQGALAIVEVLANPMGPASDEKYYEFIEIVNLSENPLELADCRVGDAPEFNVPGVDPLEYVAGDGGCESPTCLAPGARAILVGNAYLGESGGALVLATDDSTVADGGLTNTEPVVLWNSRGQAISSYRLWPDPTSEPVPTDGQSLHRIDPTAEDAASSWTSELPSPGI
jgi:hypothetical protein